ncbi:hypothetical protein LINPERPRIM_LOCUS15352, partial [Linum perenne]
NYSVPSSVGLLNSSKCQFQEFEEGINRLRTQMEDAHKQLRILEGNVSQISTLYEADYHQQILHQILKRVLMQKQVLEEKLASRSSSQAAGASNSKGLISVTQQAAAPPNLMDWIPPPQQQQLDHTLHAAHQHQVYYSSLGHTSENDNHRDDWPHVADVNLDHLCRWELRVAPVKCQGTMVHGKNCYMYNMDNFRSKGQTDDDHHSP